MSDESAYLLNRSDPRIALLSLKCHSPLCIIAVTDSPIHMDLLGMKPKSIEQTEIQILHMHILICVKQKKHTKKTTKSHALSAEHFVSSEAISTGSI